MSLNTDTLSSKCSHLKIYTSEPHCYNMQELPLAKAERARLTQRLKSSFATLEDLASPLFIHLSHGLAYTTGSALGSEPPSVDTCLNAYTVPNTASLTAGARAWSKHSHRSIPHEGWWGRPSGPVATINEKALLLFWRIMNGATWRNLHWLPHQVLVYEVRVAEGYGMRWSQNQSNSDDANVPVSKHPWVFRGFVEPMMENGHEVGWRH
ncbi:hypothetical protein BDQ17DRAFT_1284769, partial [Cyathus striatus]